LRDEAVAALRSASSMRGFERVAAASAFPSFADARRVELFASRDGDSAAARTTRWRMTLDVAKFSSPVERLRHPRPLAPTVEVDEVPVAVEVVRALLHEASGLRVAPWVHDRRFGVDGTSRRLELECGLGARSAFEWREDPPAGWERIGAPFERTLALGGA
jgi:hypothetical protein